MRTRTDATDVDCGGVARPDLHTAYIAQDIALADRRSNGEVVTGVKLGLTSRAKQQQMGVDEPSVAWLTDAMVLPAGLPVPADRLIHPRAEPEIAFVMGRRLAGPGVTAATALAAVDVILGAIEIIDSRYSGFKFTLADAVADNNSSGVYVTGDRSSRGRRRPAARGLPARDRRSRRRQRDRVRGAREPGRSPRLRRQHPRCPRTCHRGRLDRPDRRHDRRRRRRARRAGRRTLHHARIHHTRGRIAMPIIDVTLTQGRSPEQLRTLIHELTLAAQRAVDAPLTSIRVMVREVPSTHFAAGDDVTIAERRSSTS